MSNGILKESGPGTKLVHSGEIEDESYQSVVTPIYRSTTYRSNESVYALIKKYGRTEDPERDIEDEELKALRYAIFYTRDGNPNAAAVQKKMAALEGCEE